MKAGIGPAPRRRGWVGSYAAIGAALVALYFVVPAAAEPWVYSLVVVSSAAAVALGIKLHRPEHRAAWVLLAGAMLCLAAGDIAGKLIDDEVLTAPFYLAAYGQLVASVVMLVGRRARLVGLLDGAIVALAFGVAQGFAVIAPLLAADRDEDVVAHAIALAYPTLDVLLLLTLVQLSSSGWSRPSYRLVAVAIGLLLIGDEWYSIAYSSYAEGGFVNAFWMGAGIVAGVAALHPSMRELPAPPAHADRWLTQVRVALLGGAMLLTPMLGLLALHRDDHSMRVAEDVMSAVIAALVLVRFVGMVRDLEKSRGAERRARAEAEAARAGVLAQNHRLREVDKVKDGVLASISHEFRSPLTSIRGHLRLVSDQAGERLDERHRRSLAVIDRSSARLLKHVEDLLLVAQLRGSGLELQVEPVDVARIAAECVEAARPVAAARGVEITLLAAEDSVVLGEGARIAQVVDNLLSNAVKFSHDGGQVEVKVIDEMGEVAIEVADGGVGIPETERVHLFEPFNRGQAAATRHTQGTGLGLFIAHAIVHAHSGRIAVDSKPGSGTRMRVYLPTEAREFGFAERPGIFEIAGRA